MGTNDFTQETKMKRNKNNRRRYYTGKEYKCQHCDKLFNRVYRKHRIYKYCSRECYFKAIHKRTLEKYPWKKYDDKRICKQCGKPFERVKDGDFCSTKCFGDFRKGKKTGQVPWNKGKTGVYDKKTINIMRKSRLGKPSKIRGKNNSRYKASRKNRILLCDKIWSIIIRERNYCYMCNKIKENYHAHHIFSRNSLSTRFDIDNGICLCPICHYKIHSDSTESYNLINKLIKDNGQEWYNNLNKKHNQIIKWGLPELEKIEIELWNYLDNLKK